MFRMLIAQIAVLLVTTLAIGQDLKLERTEGGYRFEQNGFWISGSHLDVRTGSPLVVFGKVQPPGGNPIVSYFVICRGDQDQLLRAEVKCEPNVSGMVATDHSRIGVGKKSLEIRYRAEIERAINGVVTHALTVNGQKVDLADGRVLLADFSGEKVTWTQVKTTLPTPPGRQSTKTIASFVQETIGELRADHPAVRDFFKSGLPNGISPP